MDLNLKTDSSLRRELSQDGHVLVVVIGGIMWLATLLLSIVLFIDAKSRSEVIFHLGFCVGWATIYPLLLYRWIRAARSRRYKRPNNDVPLNDNAKAIFTRVGNSFPSSFSDKYFSDSTCNKIKAVGVVSLVVTVGAPVTPPILGPVGVGAGLLALVGCRW